MSSKKAFSLRLNKDHVAIIDKWRNKQDIPVSFAAVIDTAIERFIEELDKEPRRPPAKSSKVSIARGVDNTVPIARGIDDPEPDIPQKIREVADMLNELADEIEKS